MSDYEMVTLEVDTQDDRARVVWEFEHGYMSATVARDEIGVAETNTFRIHSQVNGPPENTPDPLFRHKLAQTLTVEVFDIARDQPGDTTSTITVPLDILDRSKWSQQL